MLLGMGFKASTADPCLFSRKESNGQTTFMLIYVDDILVAGFSEELINTIYKELQKHVKMKDLGQAKHYLGIEIDREKDGSFKLSQKSKIKQLIKTYKLEDSKGTLTPIETGFLSPSEETSPKLPNNNLYRKAIGSLLYIATVSRPDVSLAVNLLSRKIESPTESDWKAVKRVMRYLATTVDKSLLLQTNEEKTLMCYVDADWAGDSKDRKSTNGYVFQFAGRSIAWSSRKQTPVAMSSTEAEYVAASHAS
ncbi:uncharacterized protein LOC129945122 [Eupeodes corollae]|uniref:uncharacterized protein LOC129945122 n=1 Tax=Eupeodes corollae TaxID=290404 RepID=UPI0024934299|nr:uncharacterized protein LOC129945122 [Eupeodes corollae]